VHNLSLQAGEICALAISLSAALKVTIDLLSGELRLRLLLEDLVGMKPSPEHG
jgi:hypothetical protein